MMKIKKINNPTLNDKTKQWFDKSCADIKRKTKKHQRLYKKENTEKTLDLFLESKKQYRSLIKQKRKNTTEKSRRPCQIQKTTSNCGKKKFS